MTMGLLEQPLAKQWVCYKAMQCDGILIQIQDCIPFAVHSWQNGGSQKGRGTKYFLSYSLRWLKERGKVVLEALTSAANKIELKLHYKLDGVGPVDNRPSTDKLQQFVRKKENKWWHATCDTWPVTCDTCHLTQRWWWTLPKNFRSLALTVWE